MALIHQVYDTDAHFKIDPVTRAIRNGSSGKNVLIQGDHNSERFTFELPKLIDGHDMSKCNCVQVHYINTDSTNRNNISSDFYDVQDLQISPEDDTVVICSWLIEKKVTKYAGSLSFLLKFKCIADDGSVSYVWNTARFNQISVSSGIDNNKAIDPEEGEEGNTPAGTREITANGTYDVTAFAFAKVNVPIPDGYVPEDSVPGYIPDGFIKPSGILVVTENGEYDATQYAKVDVDVPTSEDSPLPINVSTEADMTALLDTAEVGSVYQYTGETTDTYTNGALYIVSEE